MNGLVIGLVLLVVPGCSGYATLEQQDAATDQVGRGGHFGFEWTTRSSHAADFGVPITGVSVRR